MGGRCDRGRLLRLKSVKSSHPTPVLVNLGVTRDLLRVRCLNNPSDTRDTPVSSFVWGTSDTGRLTPPGLSGRPAPPTPTPEAPVQTTRVLDGEGKTRPVENFLMYRETRSQRTDIYRDDSPRFSGCYTPTGHHGPGSPHTLFAIHTPTPVPPPGHKFFRRGACGLVVSVLPDPILDPGPGRRKRTVSRTDSTGHGIRDRQGLLGCTECPWSEILSRGKTFSSRPPSDTGPGGVPDPSHPAPRCRF